MNILVASLLILLLASCTDKPSQIKFTNETHKGWYSHDGANWRWCESTRWIIADPSRKEI